MEDNIEETKKELVEKFNINTDRDLIAQLGIKEEDKAKLHTWIRYQSLHAYRNGKKDLKEELKDISLENGNDSTFGGIVRKVING